MFEAGDHFSATRVAGEWRVLCHDTFLQPGVAAALARSFSGAAAPAGQQERQLAAEAQAGQSSMFKVGISVPHGSSSQQASELASLARALAAFDDLDLDLWAGPARPAAAHALLQPVAARLVAVGIVDARSEGVMLGALQRLVLPRLSELRLNAYGLNSPNVWTLGAVKAVAGLDAPRLAAISFCPPMADFRATIVAAVTALAGRPQPVGPDGRPAGLTVAFSEIAYALSDEEMEEVRTAVAALSMPCWITLVGLQRWAQQPSDGQ